MVRERSLDEFESIFEQASIPVLEIKELALTRIAAVLTGDPLDECILDLAGYVKTRFNAEVKVHWAAAMGADAAGKAAGGRGLDPAAEPFASTAELVGQIIIGNSRLVLLPEPESDSHRLVDLDTLVEVTAPPILVVRNPIEEPASVFRQVLHSLTGNFQQTQNFSYSFRLVEESGAILLLHAVNDADLEEVRQALQVSPDITEETGEELLERMAQHGERFLKGVVAASRTAPYDVSYRIVVGEVVEMVRRELAGGEYGLLVVGCHAEGRSHVTADDYQLMHSVRDIPVLAL
jgi:hypothetical protein